MEFIKRYLKFIIGIAVLIFVVVVFFLAQNKDSLEGSNLKTWRAAPLERRTAAAKILMGHEENIDIIVQCVDKIATLPDSGEMAIRDAVSLCYTGMKVKENI